MSMTNDEMAAKIQTLTEELAALKARTRSRSRSRSKERNSKTNTNSEGGGSNSEDGLTSILKNYSDALKGLSTKILTNENSDPTLTGVINSLSKSRVSRAVSDFSQQGLPNRNTSFGFNSAPPVAPKLVAEENKAESKVLRENLASLKDLFKSAFSGVQSEDFTSYLQTTAELAEASKLSLSQFYLLLRSRITPGTALYKDITYNYNNKTPAKDLFAELIPLYGERTNYLLNLQRFENFEIPPNTPPIEVLSQVKSIVMDLAYSNGGKEDKREFIYMRVREKMLSLYPTVAPFIVREETASDNNLGNFTRLFNRLSPMAVEKRKGKVNEVKVEGQETVFEVTGSQPSAPPSRTIKLTKQHLNRLKDKCFKV